MACRPARGDVEQLLREKKVHKCGGWLVKEPTQVRRGALKGKVKLAVAERSRACPEGTFCFWIFFFSFR